METPNIRLLEGTEPILKAAVAGDAELAAALGVGVPEQWTEFGTGAFAYSLDKLQADPNAAGWWTWFPILTESNTLVGSCGFKGPPDANGMVELGYEVAVSHRNRGFATAITRLLIAKAWDDASVRTVQAHTLAEENASVAVLRKCGFANVETLSDPDEGDVWRWELKRD